MTYVDAEVRRRWGPCGRYRYACHLVADSIPELHQFADTIGLKRRWFQNHPRLPHYDLTQTIRRRAVLMGAKEIDRNQLVAMMTVKERNAT